MKLWVFVAKTFESTSVKPTSLLYFSIKSYEHLGIRLNEGSKEANPVESKLIELFQHGLFLYHYLRLI